MAITNKDIKRALHRLRIGSGDTVLIKQGTPMADLDAIRQIDQVLKATGKRDVVLLVVDDFDDIKSLPESEMIKHGWLRKEKIQSLILRPVKPKVKPEKDSDESD